MCFRKQVRMPWSFHVQQSSQPIELAIKQLGDDLEHVLDASLTFQDQEHQATLLLLKDPTLQQAESWQIHISDNQIRLHYADDLGAVYGIYHISEHLLGFEPLWFWKQVLPAKLDELVVQVQTIDSYQAVFRYRGWFLNDEDYLCQWHDGGGKRNLDYPHYQYVAAPCVMKRVFEAILRTGGNMIIPGSFVNVMNDAEARLVTQAVEHGLYVSQHHIEPLGVTAHSYETYWAQRGKQHPFAYAQNPEPIRQTWRAYAQEWWDLAGEQTIWQMGLRGKGDRPIWDYDQTVTQDIAGQYISRALADQWEIICQIDTRTTPLATTTLWHEGAQLMATGKLNIPKSVAVIFSDKGSTQCMQEDFHHMPRDPDRQYGVYYHAGYWIHGSHSVQGTRLEKMQSEMLQVIAKGDTHYAIINTANIREHVLPIAAFSQLMRSGHSWQKQAFMEQWAPATIQQLYDRFFDTFVALPDERSIQDGYIWMMCQNIVDYLIGKRDNPGKFCDWPNQNIMELRQALLTAANSFDQIVQTFPTLENLPQDQQQFYQHNLREQARMMSTMYRIGASMILGLDDPNQHSQTAAHIKQLLNDRQTHAQGHWENWYRGETKECWESLYKNLLALIVND